MSAARSSGPAVWYAAVWRWHFYAGLLCVPFIVWLACTGSIYLWKPQIEAWLDRPHAGLALAGAPAPAAAQARAAVGAVPGSMLHKYRLPARPDEAVQIVVGTRGQETRVYVHPESLAILKTVKEEDRLMRVVFRLHGELMLGERGSWIVELAASWAVVMILTGLYLWWRRGRGGAAGLLWPRLSLRGRAFWRDLHGPVGLWVSAFALLLLFSGLPWASAWGDYFKEVRRITGTAVERQDWSTGRREEQGPRAAAGTRAMLDEHADHGGMAMRHPAGDHASLDLVVAAARQQRLAPPVMIAPPTGPNAPWTVASEAGDRPMRATLTIDGASGRVLSRTDFADRHPVDRVVGYGIALHEGQLFGLANQIIGLLTAIGLVLLAVSGAVMWWRRWPDGVLGAPLPQGRPRFGGALLGLVALLGVLLPFFGLSLLAMLLVERGLLRRWPAARRWLGLAAHLPHRAGG